MGCEHRLCHCDETAVEREGKQFCSEACAIEATTHRHVGECHCGHAGCEAVGRETGPAAIP